jgi:hypothetical protein
MHEYIHTYMHTYNHTYVYKVNMCMCALIHVQFTENKVPPEDPQFDLPVKAIYLHTISGERSWGEVDSLLVLLRHSDRMHVIDARSYAVCTYSDRAAPFLHFNHVTATCLAASGDTIFTADAAGDMKVLGSALAYLCAPCVCVRVLDCQWLAACRSTGNCI